MTIALSTQNFDDHPDHSALDRMAPLGFTSIFLGAGLWPSTIRRIRKRERHVAALSVFVERPFGLRWDDDPVQKLPLLTTDRELRQRLIFEASKSLLFAAELEVSRVVVPLLTEEDCPRKLLLDAARSLLEPLLDAAYRSNVQLCVSLGASVEAPLHTSLPQESNQSIPTERELLDLFSAFSGAPMSYWHKARQQPKPATRAQPPEKRAPAKPPAGSILLVSSSSLPFELSSYNPALAAMMATHGDVPPPKTVSDDVSLWLPRVNEGLLGLCSGVEVEALQREDFLEHQTEQLWVID